MRRKKTARFLILLFHLSLLFSATAAAVEFSAEPQPTLGATLLTELPIEELMQVKIFSVSKSPEVIMEAAAAIYVITREEIGRSGVTSIVEALRLAPGIHVARIDSNKWAVSSRGFSDRYANKLLVLQDGRSIYTPSFSGVLWNIQDIMLEDVERIEVIRGPGSTLWGANAMNGVINIVTRSAQVTTGGLISASGGDFEKRLAALRYGFKASDDFFIRAYGKFFSRGDQTTSSGFSQEGDWDNKSGGFRADWTASQKDTLTFQGDLYDSQPGSGDYSGGNILGRWKRKFSATSSTLIQIYYSHAKQQAVNAPETKYREERETTDLELQYNFRPIPSHNVVIGAGYRFSRDKTGWFFPVIYFSPESKSERLKSLFLQDHIHLLPELLSLNLGLRAEHNDYTGFEIQPTGRLAWTPNNRHTVWTAISRAVRTPSRVQDGIVAQPLSLLGSTELQAESLIAYDLGYRHQPSKQLWFDLALFYNDYDDLIGVAPTGTGAIQAANNVQGESWGAELATFWQPSDFFDLKLTYSWLEMKMRTNGPQPITDQLAQIGTSPEQQFSLRSGIPLPLKARLDLWLRCVDKLERGVKGYAELDVRLSWKPSDNLELSLVGQNLLHARRYEFVDDVFGSPATMTERSAYGKVIWMF